MNRMTIIDEIAGLMAQVPLLTEIKTPLEYQEALCLMDALVEDGNRYRGLISCLVVAIKNWEDTAVEFEEFNRAVRGE